MQAASTRRLFGKWAQLFFFSLSNILLQTRCPKTKLYSRHCLASTSFGEGITWFLSLDTPAPSRTYISYFYVLQFQHSSLGKIFITITQHKLINRERIENYLVGSKNQANFYSVSKHLTLWFSMFVFKEGRFRQNTQIHRVCFVSVRPAWSHGPCAGSNAISPARNS